MAGNRVAVLGATGAVGREIIAILEESDVAVGSLVPLASARSAGSRLRFRGQELPVLEVDARHFAGVDFALFSAGADRSLQWAPVAVQAGAVVIDNSSAFRMRADVPLVVPEVNAHRIDGHAGILANPNCSTIQMVLPLRCIDELFGLRRVVVATYQSVSGAGSRSMQELHDATRAVLDGTPEPRVVHPRGIAFDVVPHIDVLDDRGWTREERKMRDETRKILERPQLPVSATCVRVPVMRCHSEAVWVQTEKPVDLARLEAALRAASGITLAEQANGYRTARQMQGGNDVHVGRLRLDDDDAHAMSLWVVSDNLRKGAAWNAVQILQCLTRTPTSLPESG